MIFYQNDGKRKEERSSAHDLKHTTSCFKHGGGVGMYSCQCQLAFTDDMTADESSMVILS